MRITFPEFKESSGRSGMSSMVDIAFLLLIFFLVATTIMPTERDLPMKLPVPHGEAMDSSTPVWIEITPDNSVIWGQGEAGITVAHGGDGRELPVLKRGLEAAVAAAGSEELGVMLMTDDGVSTQRFTDVLNCLAACGVLQVSLVERD
ncbi:ExbD/TolR family protein [Haloferula rosea]|uniref:Biopolymer transporter ExbD n=1 Tax=Haloferula rosea TaxID=490093 RepID=A0A934REF9_9BACT|nr:biopolymer transporter ExbD [Haloferula rosea]MBK1827621.1 biopolymer transporter ExbD [Haloferula rosea]